MQDLWCNMRLTLMLVLLAVLALAALGVDTAVGVVPGQVPRDASVAQSPAPRPEVVADQKSDHVYPWLSGAPVQGPTIRTEVEVPEGFARVETDDWGGWLNNLPVREEGAPVRLLDGQPKRNQNWHYRVIDLDVLPMQECADTLMRLRAEYLLSRGETFRFSGMSFSKGKRAAFEQFLGRMFARKGTFNLAGDLRRPPERRVLVGDMLVQGGSPGHVVMVVDVVQRGSQRKLLLANGFMPAQDFHVIRHRNGGVWYDEQDLQGGMYVPVGGLTFTWEDLRRF